MPRPPESKYTIRRRRSTIRCKRAGVVSWGGAGMTGAELREVQLRLRAESRIVRERLGG